MRFLLRSDFIAAESGAITSVAYGSGAWGDLVNTDVTGGDIGSGTAIGNTNSLHFNDSTLWTVNLAGSSIVNSGGIIVGSGATNGAAISGGTLLAPSGGDLWIYLNGKNLTVNSVIGDNNTSGLSLGGSGGVLTMNAANAYSGPTNVLGGTLAVGAAGSIAAGSTVNVNGGATLSNTGAVNGSVNVFGTLANNGIISGTLAVNSGGTATLNGGSTTGPIAANGTLTFGNTTNTALTVGAVSGTGSGAIVYSNTWGAGNTLNFAAGSSSFANITNSSVGGTLILTGSGATVNITTGNGLLSGANAASTTEFQSGTYNFSNAFGNGGNNQLGTWNVTGGTVNFNGGGRYAMSAGGTLNISAGSVVVPTDRFNSEQQSAGTTQTVNVSGSGLLDIYNNQYGWGPGTNTTANLNDQYNQTGGLVQSGVGATSYVTGLILGNATSTNSTFAYNLSGGTLRSASIVSGGAAQASSSISFNWTGGTLTVGTYNAANLTGNDGIGAAATGTLFAGANTTLAPGFLGSTGTTVGIQYTGRTTITGNYQVDSSSSTLAINLGGTTAATSFKDTVGKYDNVAVSGTASLAGNLSVGVINTAAGLPFLLSPANTFTILTGAAVSGGFASGATVSLSNDPFVGTMNVTVGGTSVVLGGYSGNEYQAIAGATWGSSLTSNWTKLVDPNGSAYGAKFGGIGGGGTVTLDDARTVGILMFENASGYSLVGSSTLTLQGNGASPALVAINSGAHTVATPVTLGSDLLITGSSGAGLSVSGGISGASKNITLNASGASVTFAGANDYNNTVVSSGTLTVGDGSTSGNLGSGTVTDNGVLVFNRSDSVTLGSAISGTGALKQAGTGTLILTASNTLTGATTVNSGTLQLGDGSSTGSISGGIVNNSALVFNPGAGGASVNTVISGSGTIQKTGANTLTLSAANTYTGNMTINGGVLRATTSAQALGNTGATLTLAGGEVQLAIDAGTVFKPNVVVTNDARLTSDRNTLGAGGNHSLGTLAIGANTLTIGGGANVNAGTVGVTFGATTLSDSPTFDIVNPVGGGITTLTLGALTNNENTPTVLGSGNLSQTGVWSGGGGLTLGVSGGAAYSGIATLSQANTFTGNVRINSGNVVAGNSTALGISNTVYLGDSTGSNSATLSLGGGTISYANPIELGNTSGSLSLNSNSYVTLNGAISGSHDLIVTGTVSRLILGGTNTGFTGNLILAAGTFQPMTSSLSAANAVAIASGAFLDQNGNNGITIAGLNDVSGAGGVVENTGGVFRTLTLAGSGEYSFSGTIISAPMPVVIGLTGEGKQTFTGLNVYTNTTTINSGVLSISNLASPATVATQWTTVSGTNTATVANATGLAVGMAAMGTASGTPLTYPVGTTITGISGNTITLSANANAVFTASTVSFGYANGLGISSNAAANLVINGGTLQFSGTNAAMAATDRLFTVGLNGATLDASGSVPVSFTNSGSLSMNGSGTHAVNLIGSNTGANTLASVIPDNGGATSVTKSGAGNWVLSGNNTHSGGTTVNGGTLQLGNANALGTGAVAVNGGTLDLGGHNAAIAALSGSTGASITNSVSGTSTLTTTVASGTSTYEGAIANGAGSVALTKAGAGTLILGGSLSMAGLTANEGVAALTQSGSIGAVTVSGSGAVTLTAHTGAYKVLDTSSLSISAGGRIDLWNNAMILRASGTSENATNVTAVKTAVNAASNGLQWNGAGLGSTTAFNEAQPGHTQALALMVYDNSVIKQSSFEGVSGLGYFDGASPVGFNEVLVKLTYLGDFNADGVINASDYTWLDGYALGANPLGDLNGDGVVNATDYTWLDGSALNQSFGVLAGQQSGSGASPATPTIAAVPAGAGAIAASPEAVPEPGALALLLSGALGLFGMRRNRRKS